MNAALGRAGSGASEFGPKRRKKFEKEQRQQGLPPGRAAPCAKNPRRPKTINDLSRKIADIEARWRSGSLSMVEKTLPPAETGRHEKNGRPGIFLAEIQETLKTSRNNERRTARGTHTAGRKICHRVAPYTSPQVAKHRHDINSKHTRSSYRLF